MKIPFQGVIIDGLNVSDDGYDWKNRLIITNGRKHDQCLANVFVKVKNGITEGGIKQSENFGESQEIAAIFLSCYQLITNSRMPKIIENTGGGTEIDEQSISSTDFPLSMGDSRDPPSNRISIDETMSNIQKTIPLFDTVMNIIDSKSKHRLDTSLVMYYRSWRHIFAVENFLNLVTSLEALFSEGTEIRQTLSLRTAIFTETDVTKRKELFEYLKKMYKDRSNLVHGRDVSLNPLSDYTMHEVSLRKIVRKSLINYIDLASKGKTKKEIIVHIDDLALGKESP